MKTVLDLRFRLGYRFLLLFLAVTPFATASLLIDPTGGTAVGLSSNTIGVERRIGGTFSLFGSDITTINIQDSGYLGTGGTTGLFLDRDLPILAAASEGAVIAPFYDHLALGDGTSVVDNGVADTYYVVTYQSMYGFDDTTPGHTSDFQVVLFMADTNIGGFQFMAGDIAMSYGNLASTLEGTFTVGVASDTSNWRGTPDGIFGELTDVSTLPTGSQFFLYRPHTEPLLPALQFAPATLGERTVYDVSIETTAPEPASLALAALGLIGIALWRRR
jgi:MYXO-CTERM domain-containing protein